MFVLGTDAVIAVVPYVVRHDEEDGDVVPLAVPQGCQVLETQISPTFRPKTYFTT